MKTVFKRAIDPEKALELAELIIARAMDGVNWAFEGLDHDNIVDHAGDGKGSIVYRPDSLSGKNTVSFIGKDTIELFGDAISGNHSLIINVGTGDLTVIHEGKRRSFPGNALDLLPEIWFDELNKAQDWILCEYETSEETWAATAGFLDGKVGTGPKNLEELETAENAKKEAIAWDTLINKHMAAGRDIPDLYFDPVQDCFFMKGTQERYIPKWTAFEYRRAGACGVSL